MKPVTQAIVGFFLITGVYVVLVGESKSQAISKIAGASGKSYAGLVGALEGRGTSSTNGNSVTNVATNALSALLANFKVNINV